ncbi:adhesion G protein-coupled receptor E2 [Ditylenchus destructor]|nr:adhesion G protein-coupled receptor E2 [Ditylenchus destructor]
MAVSALSLVSLLILSLVLVNLTLAHSNACKESYDLHDCDEISECVSTQPGSYQCRCPKGYADRSPDPVSKPGRKCEKVSDCSICSPNASCEQTYDGAKCQCKPGFVDKSPGPEKGRRCEKDCSICSPNAVCEQSYDGPKCQCKPGFIDQSTGPDRGRRCEKAGVCSAGEHDCDANARCVEKPNVDPGLQAYVEAQFTCICLPGFRDRSLDPVNKPGRLCVKQETCATNGQVCSRNALCENVGDSFTCRCKEGYVDQSADPAKPGRTCVPEDPCANNNCDSAATCYPLSNGGFTCKCNGGYRDQDSAVNVNTQGRNCVKRHPCQEKTECDPKATCQELADGLSYTCICPANSIDNSVDKTNKPGRVCVEASIDEPATEKPAEQIKTTIPCGPTKCKIELGEVCLAPGLCGCPTGQGRSTPNDKCQPMEKIPLIVRIVEKGPQEPVLYSSEFGNNRSAPYVELADEFRQDMGKAIGSTDIAPKYITSDVSYITHPKTVNSTWGDGILVNFTAGVVPGSVDRCDLWDKMMDSFQQTNQQIGGGKLKVASDVNLLTPCPPTCGGVVCNAALGEVCIAGSVCGCPSGQKRASKNEKCYEVEPVKFPLWVIRKNQDHLVFNSTFDNPQDAVHKEYVNLFESGVAQSYPQTKLKESFVVAEVNEIFHPNALNGSWDKGIIFNSTMYFKKGTVTIPSDTYYTLIRWIMDKNDYQIGHSGLYLNPYQPDIFKACFKNDCHPKGICIDIGPHEYRCECGANYRDLNPTNPGHDCIPNDNFGDCDSKSHNNCSENARCIELDHLYKCECLPGFEDTSPPGAIAGSVCTHLPCSDVNFCPANTTCVNLPNHEAKCQCNREFVDISHSENRVSLGLSSSQCMNPQDVCALGLHNCSKVAICTPKPPGDYTCSCPPNYVDGDPSNPGRICAGLLCPMCNQHGDCVHDPKTNNITCACADGWTGEFCALSATSLPAILFIILALLFLLLALCCLLYLCTKCRCFKRHREVPWSAMDSGSDISDLYSQPIGIPRAKLGGDSDSLGSDYTIREEIERRVTTDITRTEQRIVETEDESHEVMDSSASAMRRHEYYPS